MNDRVKFGKPIDYNPFQSQPAVQPQAMTAEQAGITPLPEPVAATSDITSAPMNFGDSLQNFFAVMSMTDPQGLQDIIVRNIQGAQPGTDKNGNPFVVIGGKPFYTNQPGLSGTDVAGFVGDIAKFIPAGKLAGLASNWAMRMGLAGLGTAGISSASQLAAQAQGSQQPFDYKQVGLESVFGAAGQGVGDVIVNAIKAGRPIMSSPDQYTPEFIQATRSIGIDINALGDSGKKVVFDAYRSLGRQFGREASSIVSSANVADSSIRLTRGQATGDVRQMALEEAMRNGARGSLAQRILQRFDDGQQADISSVTGRVQESQFTPKSLVPLANQQEAGAVLSQQLRNKAAQMKQEGSQAYQAVDLKDLRLASETLGGLEERVRAQFTNSDYVIDPVLTPSAQRAAQDIQKIAPQTGGATLADVSLKSLETTRRRLNTYYQAASNDADRQAVRIMQNEFDSWLDDAVTNGLIRGDEAQLGKLKEARALWSRYKQSFKANPKAADADAQKVIEKLTTKDLQPSRVMNYLYGSADIGNAAVAQRVASRLKNIYGQDSAEFMRLREAAFLRIMQDTQGGLKSPQKVVSTIDELVMGKGSGLTRELFTAEQINAIRKMRADLAKTIVPAEAKNPSKTGYEMARLLEDMAKRFGLGGAAFQAASGDMATAGLLGASAGIRQLRSAAQAYRATAPTSSPYTPRYPSVFTGVGAGSAESPQSLYNSLFIGGGSNAADRMR